MTDALLARRRRLMGPNVPTFYDRPIHITRGEGVWLWDAEGRRYLDCYNNVPHVGHCHPRVVAAICEQAARLNTHTRYLHELVLDYIDRLTATLSHDLSQMVLCCTGSEANDIALRMAQAVTRKTGVIATDNTYHGNTTATAQLSTRRPPIGGYPDHVRLVPAPERRPGETAICGERFGAHVADAIADLERAGIGFSALIVCPIFANEGLPDIVPGFLDPAAAAVRAAGGLLISDEVQPGFGRCGSHFWGHGWLGAAPDIVTLGKPMGNGHPIAGVVARPDVIAAFRSAFGYFNTFGGNPVSCAAAMAVLDVLEDDELQANAAATGAYTLERLRALDHPLIAEVRGRGLFFGLELVDGDGRPATAPAAALVEAMRERGILLNRIGRHMNILKMRPPMPFSAANADLALDGLADALTELVDARHQDA